MNKKRYYRYRSCLSTVMVVLVVLFPVSAVNEVKCIQSTSTTHSSSRTMTPSSSTSSLKFLNPKIDSTGILNVTAESATELASVVAVDQCKVKRSKKHKHKTKRCPKATKSKCSWNEEGPTAPCQGSLQDGYTGQCFKIKYTTVTPTTKQWSIRHKICPKFQMAYEKRGLDSTKRCSAKILQAKRAGSVTIKNVDCSKLHITPIQQKSRDGPALVSGCCRGGAGETSKRGSTTVRPEDSEEEDVDGDEILPRTSTGWATDHVTVPMYETATDARLVTDATEVWDDESGDAAETTVAVTRRKKKKRLKSATTVAVRLTTVAVQLTTAAVMTVTTTTGLPPRFSMISPMSIRRGGRGHRKSQFRRTYDDYGDDYGVRRRINDWTPRSRQ